MQNNNSARRLTASVLTIIILALCLCITTFALVWATVSVDDNFFRTGKVEINLNDGKPVIEEHEFLFEPGMTVVKEFFIENTSTWDVYYRLYFEDVSGGLADVLEITIRENDKVLFYGKPSELTKQLVGAADDTLYLREKKELEIVFHYPESSGNSTQNAELTFTLCADAVQTKNNPNKEFD